MDRFAGHEADPRRGRDHELRWKVERRRARSRQGYRRRRGSRNESVRLLGCLD